MLQIKTFVALSKIHGLGLFAGEDIPKGAKLWKFVPGIDVKITQEQMDTLPEVAKEYLYFYTYRNKITGEYILSSDGDRYTNHSTTPNSINIGFEENEGETFALTDIKKGEEITTNYGELEGIDFNYN